MNKIDQRRSQGSQRRFGTDLNQELNEKRPQETPRQPKDDFVSLLIKKLNKKRPPEEPRQPKDDFVSFN